MSEEDEENFENATIVWKCEQPFLIESPNISFCVREKNRVKSIPD